MAILNTRVELELKLDRGIERLVPVPRPPARRVAALGRGGDTVHSVHYGSSSLVALRMQL